VVHAVKHPSRGLKAFFLYSGHHAVSARGIFEFEEHMDGLALQVACTNREYSKFCLSFVNSRQTLYHGSHVDAFWKGLKEAGAAAGKAWKLNKWKKCISCVVALKIEAPNYAGATKERLYNPEIVTKLSQLVKNRMGSFFDDFWQVW
jgi:DNA gyrase/topoisomerase IV subunit B